MTHAERERTALHEAGHHVVAVVYGWELGVVTIEPGTSAAGCSLATPPLVEVPAGADYDSEPFIRWPESVRQRIEGEALLTAAGDVAELLFTPRPVRSPEPAAVKAIEMLDAEEPQRQAALPAALPAATADERAKVAALCDDPSLECDADRLARLARYAHWGDPAAAGAWLGYVETQARALLLAHERRVRRLACALLAAGTVGAEAAARLLA